MNKEQLKRIYTEYLLRFSKEVNSESKAREHIKRFWLNIITIKSYDLVSKNCLNTIFRDVLKDFGIKRSVEFSDDLKQMWKGDIFWFMDNSEIKFNDEIAVSPIGVI